MDGLTLFGISMVAFFVLLVVVSLCCLNYNRRHTQKPSMPLETNDALPKGFTSDNCEIPFGQVRIRRANTNL